MSDSLAFFASAQARVTVDGAGLVRAVEHRSRSTASYLTMGLPEASGLSLRPSGTALDTDEVESVLTDGAGLGITLRHAFVAGWQIRCVLVNAGTERRSLRLRLPLEVDETAVGWAVADGAEAELFVLPRNGRGPVLAGRLRQGSVDRIDLDGLHLPEVVLEPAGRYVWAWEWDWLTQPASYARKRPAIHPDATVRVSGTAIRIPASPDVALIAPDVATEPDEEGYELTAWEPGGHRVELRSARGVRSIDLTWTPAATTVLAEAATGLLAGPRGSAGVPVLPGPAAALVLQHAVAAELLDESDELGRAHDALDLFTARLDLDALHPPFTTLYLCGEHTRTGEPELLEAAFRSVLAASQPRPGLGFAATRVCVARLVVGRSPQPVTEHLLQLVERLHLPAAMFAAAELDTAESRTSAAELLAVTRTTRSFGGAVRRTEDDPLLRLVLGLGTELGCGLPGTPVVAADSDRLGHLLATLFVVPDDVSPWVRPHWGLSPGELAGQALPRLLARLDRSRPGEVGAAHAWLTLLAESD